MEIEEPREQLPQPSSQPWRRDPAHGHLAGVCAAIAQRQNVDPLLVRVAAVVLALAGGLGLGAYLVAWAMLPALGEDASVLERHVPATGTWSPQTRIIVAAVATAAIASVAGSSLGLGLGPVVVVVAVAWLVHRSQGKSTDLPASMPTSAAQAPTLDPHSDFGRAALAWQSRLAQVEGRPAPLPVFVPAAALSASPAPIEWRTSAPVAPSRRRRAPGWVSLAWIGAAAATWGSVMAFTSGTDGSVLAMAAALAVLALGLLAGTVTGRPRGLVLASLLTAASVFAPLAVSGSSMGDVRAYYASAADLPSTEQKLAGADAVLDFSQLDLSEAESGTYRMRATGADVTIMAPRNADLVLRYRLRGANLEVPSEASGTVREGSGDGEVRLDRPGTNVLVIDMTAIGADVQVVA